MEKMLRVLLVMLATVSVVQCSSKDGKSQQVEVTVDPENPIVITGDSKDNLGNEIAAPWIKFRVHISNQSNSPVTIIGIQMKVTRVGDISGTPLETSFTASNLNYSLETGDTCSYGSFGTLGPNEADTLRGILDPPVTNECAGFEFATNPGTATQAEKDETLATFFAGDLPTTEDESKANYRYKVELKPLGWFGTIDDQQDRFDRTIIFYTR